MVLTELQRRICRLIACQRIASGESYLAGGATLNELLKAPRVSRDPDLFHDTSEALQASWDADRQLLEDQGFTLQLVRERGSFIEAEVELDGEKVLMQWARDSAYRFFPLVEHDDFGLALHPVDLATNKVLALVGRLEVRDWIDVIESCRRLQPLGYLAWSASGKDAGFSPAAILEHAARTTRYSETEVTALSFDGGPPETEALAQDWRRMLAEARQVVAALPGEEVGTCVLSTDRGLFRGGPNQLQSALDDNRLVFHAGSIGGSLPTPV